MVRNELIRCPNLSMNTNVVTLEWRRRFETLFDVETMKKLISGLTGVFLCLYLISPASARGAFEPPEDDYDWIQLTSGEWLKGELFGLFNDVVEFDSDILDKLSIDWEDVSRIVSPRTYSVNVDGQETLTGNLRFEGERVIIVDEVGPVEVARDDLIGITASAERERDRWSIDISLGANVRRGNADIVEQNAIASAERRTPVSRGIIEYIGSFNETEGERVANSQRVTVNLDRLSNSRLFWRPVNIQYSRDEFQNIAHQGTLSTGLGYELRDTKRTDWQVYASGGVNYLERVSVEPGQPGYTTSPSVTIGTDFETDLTSWIEYLFQYRVTFLDEASGDRQHHILTTLSTDLIGDIDFDVSLIWDRTDSPQPAADGTIPEKDDFRLTVGVGFDF